MLSLYVVEGADGAPRPLREFVMLPGITGSFRPRIGDFNGDGLADLAYASGIELTDGRLHVVLGSASGLASARTLAELSAYRAYPSSPAVTDWNGDGYSDLVVSMYMMNEMPRSIVASALVVYLGSSVGLASRAQVALSLGEPVSRPWVQTSLELGDIDLDGYGDIYASDGTFARSGGNNFILFGTTAGTPRAQELWSDSAPPGLADGLGYAQTLGDIDGDSLIDIVVSPLFLETIYVFRSATGFASPSSVLMEPARSSDFGYRAEGGDMNGDGLADLLVGSSDSATETWMGLGVPFNSGRMYVFFGSRTGLASEPIWFDRTPPTDPDDNPQAFAASLASPGDINGDGIDDGAMADYARGTCCYAMGSPTLVGLSLGECMAVPGGFSQLY